MLVLKFLMVKERIFTHAFRNLHCLRNMPFIVFARNNMKGNGLYQGDVILEQEGIGF